jgi:hypothetical protein
MMEAFSLEQAIAKGDQGVQARGCLSNLGLALIPRPGMIAVS